MIVTGRHRYPAQSRVVAELRAMSIGDDNLVEMTKTFDVLAEYPLATEEFGEGI